MFLFVIINLLRALCTQLIDVQSSVSGLAAESFGGQQTFSFRRYRRGRDGLHLTCSNVTEISMFSVQNMNCLHAGCV